MQSVIRLNLRAGKNCICWPFLILSSKTSDTPTASKKTCFLSIYHLMFEANAIISNRDGEIVLNVIYDHSVETIFVLK